MKESKNVGDFSHESLSDRVGATNSNQHSSNISANLL